MYMSRFYTLRIIFSALHIIYLTRNNFPNKKSAQVLTHTGVYMKLIEGSLTNAKALIQTIVALVSSPHLCS